MSKIRFPDVPEEDWDPSNRARAISESEKRWIGVRIGKRGAHSFIVSRMDMIPSDAVQIEEVDSQVAKERVKKLIDEYISSKPGFCGSDGTVPDLEPGSVVAHTDGYGVHLCIILKTDGQLASMVMCTSSPYWNELSRKLTTEEAAMMGFIMKKTTYLAPVTREISDLSPLGRYFPEHRVKDLIKEFHFDTDQE